MSCQERLFKSTGDAAHVPFRDRASQATLHGVEGGDAGRGGAAGSQGAPVALRRKWERELGKLARANRTARGPRNLVPRPQPEYWQNAPEAPFRELRSEASRSQLACCNLQSSMLQHQDERGRAAYACAAGETYFWRRHPDKIANTLAFMLSQEAEEHERVRSAEVEPLRECLHYLRAKNPHLRIHLSNAERFVKLYGQLQAVVPRGHAEASVRL